MKNVIIKILFAIGSLMVLFLTIQFTVKLNNNGVGKYVPYNEKFILNTSNGNVFKPVSYAENKYVWVKVISFSRLSSREKDLEDVKYLFEDEE